MCRPAQIVDLSDMQWGVVEDHRYRTRHVDREIGEPFKDY